MFISNTIDTSYTARFIPSEDRISEHPRREHCSASQNQLRMIGINPGQQVRIERPTVNGTRVALYTIDAHNEEDPDHTVFVGYTDPYLEDLQKRLGWSSKDSFNGKINTQVTAVGLTDAEAKAYSEFIEHLTDDGYNQELAVIAPHGGDVEEGTAEEGERIVEQLSSKCVSAWICKGFNKHEDGGAFNRWHITSTDISEDSFPGLQTIMNRQFRFVIAFHGWKRNSICIGGSMSDPLKQQIKTEIEKVVPSSIVVDIAGPGSTACPDEFNGDDQRNIVNRLGTYGVQIEQSEEARDKYGNAIADAVANVFRPLIKEGGFFSPNNVIVTEQDLRNAIGTGAQTERDNWLDMTGNLLMEDEDSQFGLLVKYWLASKSRIRPTTLTAAQTKAVSPDTSYGKLLKKDATDAEISAEAATVRATLLTGAPDTVSPVDLRTLVEQSLISSRFSRFDDENRGRWSAAFVVAVVRNAAIQLGLEVMSGSTHIGRDGLLVGTSAHRVYVREAYNRRFGTNRRSGTYHAFRPEERIPQIGDIIIQDRVQANSTNNVLEFDDIPTTLNSAYNLHGDIVVEVPDGADYIIATGGNVGDSTRRRRYPLDAYRHLVVDRTQLYTQESDSGNLPDLPDTDNSPGLHARSTGRIFALLSLMQQCAAVSG